MICALPVFTETDFDYGNPTRPWWIRRGMDAWALDYWRHHDVVPFKPSKRKYQ